MTSQCTTRPDSCILIVDIFQARKLMCKFKLRSKPCIRLLVSIFYEQTLFKVSMKDIENND